jgi:hypothetical protein
MATRSEDNDTTSAEYAALTDIRRVLEKHRLELRHVLEEWIRDGVRRGLVKLGDDGLASAEGTWGHDRDTGRILDPKAFDEQHRDVDVLKWLLERGDMQRVARNLNAGAPEDVLLPQFVAASLVTDLDAVRHGSASRQVFERVAPVLAFASHERVGGKLWQHGLDNSVRSVLLIQRAGKPSADLILAILETLRFHVREVEIPNALLRPTKDRITEAVKTLKKYWDARRRRYRVLFAPGTNIKTGRPLKAGKGHIFTWGLARELTAELGGYDANGRMKIGFPEWRELARDHGSRDR